MLLGPELSVSVQPRDGGYVKLGTGHRYQVVPESISISGDLGEYGCSEASWLMRVNPRFPHYDLEHFTPVVIEDDTEPVWSGRIIATPTTYGEDGIVHVTAQGWGQHTKDDPLDRVFVHADLSSWTNSAASLSSVYTNYQGAAAEVGAGGILLPSPQNSVAVANRGVAATLDLGANNLARKAVVVIRQNGAPASASWTLQAIISNNPDAIAGPALGTPASQSNPAASTAYTLTPTSSVGGRYVHVFWFWTGATTPPLGTDLGSKIESAIVFTDSAYESANASALTADAIIKYYLTNACPLISPDQSQIEAQTFKIPEFPAQWGRKYPNEAIDQANAYHDNQFKLTPDPLPIPIYRAVPSDYTYMVGASDDYVFENPSENDGRNVYSRIITEYEDAASVRGEASAENTSYLQGGALANPDFEVGTANWTVTVGTLARDTGVFDVGTASGRMTSDAGGGFQMASTTTNLTPFKRYLMRVRFRRAAAFASDSSIDVRRSSSDSTGLRTTEAGFSTTADPFWSISASASGSFVTLDGWFTTDANGTASLWVTIDGAAATTVLGYLDAIEILTEQSTVVSRRGFRRTALRPMSSKSTNAAATAVATLELGGAQFPPLKGTMAITGRIRVKGGTTVPVNRLPASVGDNILIENLTDPNTGALGRQARIMRATYDSITDTTTVELDNPSDFVDAIRTRLNTAA